MQEWTAKMLAERAERRKTQTPSENKVEDLIDEAMATYERAEKLRAPDPRPPSKEELEWEPEEAQTVYGLPQPPPLLEPYNEERHACLALLVDAVGLAVSCYRTTLDGLARDGQEFSIRFPTTHDNARMGNGMRLIQEATQALWAASSRFKDEGDGCATKEQEIRSKMAEEMLRLPRREEREVCMTKYGCPLPSRKAHVDPKPTACYHLGRVVEEIPVPREPKGPDGVWHVTGIRCGAVYGHPVCYCDPVGCSALSESMIGFAAEHPGIRRGNVLRLSDGWIAEDDHWIDPAARAKEE
jgi:hypothetical protein